MEDVKNVGKTLKINKNTLKKAKFFDFTRNRLVCSELAQSLKKIRFPKFVYSMFKTFVEPTKVRFGIQKHFWGSKVEGQSHL